MKVLLIITGHQQVKEYFYNSFILKKNCIWISENTDLFIHINKCDVDKNISILFNMFPQKNKRLFITSKNEGYRLGGIEAISDIIDMNICNNYDYVIHTHPDVIIIQDKIIKDLLYENLNNDIAFFTNKSWPNNETRFSFDFFIFKPKLLVNNIFKTIDFYTYSDSPENFLYDIIKNNNINYKLIKRYDNDNWYPRRIDLLGVWHEHELNKLDAYIKEL